MQFDWDPKKAAANAHKHRVVFSEAILNVSFEADRVSESEFHERAAAIVTLIALK